MPPSLSSDLDESVRLQVYTNAQIQHRYGPACPPAPACSLTQLTALSMRCLNSLHGGPAAWGSVGDNATVLQRRCKHNTRMEMRLWVLCSSTFQLTSLHVGLSASISMSWSLRLFLPPPSLRFLLVPVTEAVVREHSWGKPAAVAPRILLKCGTQQATLLPCGAGTVSTKRSRWACGGVGNLACESPTERKRRGKKQSTPILCASTHNSFTQLRSINVRAEVVCPGVGPSGRKH